MFAHFAEGDFLLSKERIAKFQRFPQGAIGGQYVPMFFAATKSIKNRDTNVNTQIKQQLIYLGDNPSHEPLRRECRTASAEPVCSCALSFVHFAHETAGNSSTVSDCRRLTQAIPEIRSISRVFSCEPAQAGPDRHRLRNPKRRVIGRTGAATRKRERDDEARNSQARRPPR